MKTKHWQPALRIRPARLQDIPQIAQVHIQSWRETYTGILPEAFIAAQTPEKRLHDWRQCLEHQANVWVWVAESEAHIVGFVSGGPERTGNPDYPGEIYALYLLAAWQKQGWGGKLLRTGFSLLYQQGFRTALIWVVSENIRACQFYLRQGGQPGPERRLQIMGHEVSERAYLWSHLNIS